VEDAARLTRRSRNRFGALYVVATFLCFPQPLPFAAAEGGGDAVLDLGLVMAWVAPAALLLAIAGLGPARAALRAAVLGVLAYAAVLHWLWVVTVVYGHVPALPGVLAPVGMALYPAFFVALFAALAGWLHQRGAATPWALAAGWTALDHGRAWFLTGFPWATLGYAQHDNPALLGLASATGVYGLSFAAALGAAALAAAWRARAIRRGTQVAWVAVAALHLAGLVLRPAPIGDEGDRVRMAAIQGNVDQGVKWDRARLRETIDRYAGLTYEAAARGAQVVVWPETAVPSALELDPLLREQISALARGSRVALVIGGVGVRSDARGAVSDFYDSAFVVAPDGSWRARYDKSHLVPFGEYVPFRAWIGRWIGAVASGIASGDVSAGVAPVALDIEVAARSDASSASRAMGASSGVSDAPHRLRVGVPICYELIFPDLVRRFALDGAGVLLAITNDAWYGRTGAPYQFLAMTALRSAETGLWTLRAANTGVSAVIDGRGSVRERTRIFEPALLVADVPIRAPGWPGTAYTRYGDVFAAACWLAVVAICWRARGGVAAGADREAGEGRS